MVSASHLPFDDRPPWFSTITSIPWIAANSESWLRPSDGQLHLLLGRSLALGVDTDGVAAQVLGRFDPFVVVGHGLGALGRIGIADGPFAVDHDQAAA